MAYTEEMFERMETDPELRRGYFWTVGNKALLRAAEDRELGKLSDAQMHENYGRIILDNIDRLVETTGGPPREESERRTAP